MASRNQLCERDTHFWRLTEFRDADFAIAITLFVLDILSSAINKFRISEKITE